MNALDLLKFAKDANTKATATLSFTTGDDDVKGLTLKWEWPAECGFLATCRIVIPASAFDETRWPHFAIRSYLQMAAEKMVEKQGTPNRKSPLFATATETMDYQRQRELLDMKLNAGLIDVHYYIDRIIELLAKRDGDNRLWFGANRNG